MSVNRNDLSSFTLAVINKAITESKFKLNLDKPAKP